MNFVAHAHVALAVTTSDPDTLGVAAGAVLPDLTAMVRQRIDGSALPPAVREGIALHHRTDAIFHGTAAFREGCRRLTAAGKAAGLPAGAARAIGHAGWELLLDGCLLDRYGSVEAFDSVLTRLAEFHVPGNNGASGATPDRSHDLAWLAATLRSERWWLGYRDPPFVARAMYRRLSHRPRLAFPAPQIETVAAVLTAERTQVARHATALLSEVVSAVNQPAI